MPFNLRFIYIVFILISFLIAAVVPLHPVGLMFLFATDVLIAVVLFMYAANKKIHDVAIETCEERYKVFMEHNRDGVWRFELKEPMSVELSVEEQIDWLYRYGYFAECNMSMAKMCGFRYKESIVGQPLSFLLTKVLLGEIFLKVFVTNDYNVSNLQITEKSDDGETKYFVVDLFGVVANKKLLRGWGILKDVTKERKTTIEREELLKKAQDLNDMVEIANKERDQLMANLSHELRTPLVSIIGYAEILNEVENKEDLVKGLEVIKNNGKTQLQLVEDLLSMTGKATVNKEEFCLDGLLREKLDSLRYKYESKNIEVVFKGKPIKVFGDKAKIGQIFANLFSNAVKFTDSGTITVKFGFLKNNAFYFSVKDTGIGISKEDQKNIFTPYFQANKGTAKTRSGVGLGLYIVKTFVNLHKGFVSVTSRKGKGSTFTVKLPLNGNDLRVLGKSLEGMHILLVEDDANIGELMKLFLEREDTFVTWVRSAKEAYKELEENQFDLYVFDIAMPEEDGNTLINNLRNSGDLTPAVAVSAYSAYEEEALKNGFNLFLQKPLTSDDLVNIKGLFS